MSEQTGQHKYGWRPDKPDFRDLHYSPHARMAMTPPPFVDQRPDDLPIVDQGQEGSCTANMGAALDGRVRKAQGKDNYAASRDGMYARVLQLEGSFGWDTGAEIRDILKVIAQDGTWPEDRPNDPANGPYTGLGYKTKPLQASLDFGQNHQGLVYSRVQQNACVMKGILAQGWPIGIGFTVYESFESDYTLNTGIVTMPGPTESKLGGHAVVIVGYDDDGSATPLKGSWIVRNSWGQWWGDKGYCYFPQAYLLDPSYSDDFWVLMKVE